MNKSRIPQNWLFYRKVQIKILKVFCQLIHDPVTDRYIYTNSVDGFSINYPIILTKQYESLVLKESMRDYFKKKTDAIDGKKRG
jgi:hypothetical protein